ncbi:MAG TPA: nucleotidyltransferase domain-containing protein [Thermodesulfovibrionales bacterium]|nr:nucleotidyltransferase domain-containing protein [Thermodesulfovibrionales bacterium]
MKTPDFSKVKDYLSSRNEIIAAYVFGSYARGGLHKGSDIDIAILLDKTVDINTCGIMREEIISDLIGILSLNGVDVVVLNTASPLLSHEVIKKGRLLFSKDEKARLEYTVRASMRYLDTIHLRKVQDTILREKIRRGDFGHFKGSHKYSIEAVRKGAPGTAAIK